MRWILAQDLGEQVAVSFGVAALPARGPVRAGQAVTLLPVPQPRDRDPGPPGYLADRQHSRTGAGIAIGNLRARHSDDHR